jgi:hypothetical protein
MVVSNGSIIGVVNLLAMVRMPPGFSHKLLMFVSITFAFWQLLQPLNTKFPFSQEDHSYTIMNDVTLNPLVCNCWILYFIAGHLMVYLFMLNFMTVTAVSQWRKDPFFHRKLVLNLCKQTILSYMPLAYVGFPHKQSLRLDFCCIA